MQEVKTLNIQIDQGGYTPTRAHEDDAGLDLYSPVSIYLWPHTMQTIDTGVHIEILKGYFGEVKSRSSMMKNFIITDGTIDSGYTGSIKVVLMNLGGSGKQIEAGEKIAQLVIQPIITPKINIVDRLNETERGERGFGSTGK